jgi:type III restriction enzyme
VDAERLLSAFHSRAAAELCNKVNEEFRRVAPKPTMTDVVDRIAFGAQRVSARPVSRDRYGVFSKSSAYENWNKSLYALEWFDSSPELNFANTVDGDDAIEYWVRLHTGELGIIWTAEGRQYNADFIVREVSGDDWVVEVKADKDANSAEVQGKRDAAQRWVNRVNNSGEFENKWHYLLVTETDVRTAKGSWAALRKLGT